jgi:hypothetical protein
MTSSAERYRDTVLAYEAQMRRLQAESPGPDRWDSRAAQFRLDPRRPLDPNLAAIAALIDPADTLVDVGGGAGRVSLPLALRCQRVINVDPSPGMLREFAASAAEAGIANAEAVQAGWLDDHGVTGDTVLVCNVTYFVADIVPFVEKLVAAARRRVVISCWSVPPPDLDATLFEVALGEPRDLVPDYRLLLPVLWDLGILPDIQVLPEPFALREPPVATREACIDQWVGRLRPRDVSAAKARIDAAFDRLFRWDRASFVPTFRPDTREMLITWTTGS